MKTLILYLLIFAFVGMAAFAPPTDVQATDAQLADAFYAEYQKQTKRCRNEARAEQRISTFHTCVSYLVRTLVETMNVPTTEKPGFEILAQKFDARADVWRDYEDGRITKEVHVKRLSEIDQ
jgi:hypothetical protein